MKLKDWLKKEKIKVSALAAHLGVTKNHVYVHLRGESQFGYEVAKEVQEFTHGEVTVEELRTLPKSRCPTCGRRTKRDCK